MKYWIIGYVIAIVINYMWFRKMRSSKIGWMYNSDPTWNDVFATVGLSLIFPLGWICFFAAYWEYKGWKYKIPVPKWLVLILFVGMGSCVTRGYDEIETYNAVRKMYPNAHIYHEGDSKSIYWVVIDSGVYYRVITGRMQSPEVTIVEKPIELK